jgi:PAS domain S-box-containing protein
MKISLSVKTVTILLLFSAILFALVSYFSFNSLKSALTESFIQRAKATTNSLESGVSSRNYFNDKSQLLLVIQKNMWLDPDIEEISFSVPEGNDLVVYATSNQSKINRPSSANNKISFEKDSFLSSVVKNGADNTLEYVSPVHLSGEIVGTVQINFDLSSINKKVLTTFYYSLIVYIGLISLFLIMIYFFLSSTILKPISRINQGLNALAHNDYTYKVGIKSRDEIGALAKAFGDMVTILSGNKAEIESKVKEQTKEISEKAHELSDQKNAILNILEGVERDKNKIELLAQDLKKFKLAVDDASDQVVITDSEGTVVYANKAVETITGFAPEEVIGKKAGALWKSPMPPDFYENMWDVIKNQKKVFNSEIQNKRKNGELYTARMNVSPVLDDKKNIIYFVSIEHDISKEKAYEEQIIKEKEIVEKKVTERTRELSEEKAKLLASINSLSFSFAIVGIDGHVILKNKAMVDLFGFDENQEISIDGIAKLVGTNVDIKAEISKCLEGKEVCEIKEISFGAKFLKGIIAPVVDSDTGEMIAYVFLLEDITEARAIDRAKSEFVSLASHQLRTPLSAINWYSEMLLSGDAGELKPEQQKFTEEIVTSSKRMSTLVGTLLNVSRIEMGTFPVDPESIELSKLIEDETKELQAQIEDKEISLDVVFNLKPGIISADPKLMSIVMQNFLTNAIKYTAPKGKVIVKVDKDEPSGGVLLSVTDTGYGILKGEQDKIFTKMYRSDNARLVDADGNGLGLYMVKTALEASGCRVWFESPPKGQKEGTAFYVFIPKEGMKQIKSKRREGAPIS